MLPGPPAEVNPFPEPRYCEAPCPQECAPACYDWCCFPSIQAPTPKMTLAMVPAGGQVLKPCGSDSPCAQAAGGNNPAPAPLPYPMNYITPEGLQPASAMQEMVANAQQHQANLPVLSGPPPSNAMPEGAVYRSKVSHKNSAQKRKYSKSSNSKKASEKASKKDDVFVAPSVFPELAVAEKKAKVTHQHNKHNKHH